MQGYAIARYALTASSSCLDDLGGYLAENFVGNRLVRGIVFGQVCRHRLAQLFTKAAHTVAERQDTAAHRRLNRGAVGGKTATDHGRRRDAMLD